MTALAPKSSPAPVTYKAFIGGEWVDAQGGATFESEDPFSGDIWALFKGEKRTIFGFWSNVIFTMRDKRRYSKSGSAWGKMRGRSSSFFSL